MNKYPKEQDKDAFGGAHTIQSWIDRARIEKQYTWANRLLQVLVYVKMQNGKIASLEQTIIKLTEEKVPQ